MKKILLIILYVLGLGYTSSSLADVTNFPIICSLNVKSFKTKILTGAEFDNAIKKLIDEPKLILQHGFYNHEQKIKSLNLKCPSGTKTIKPYTKDKSKLSPSYLREIRKRRETSRTMSTESEAPNWIRETEGILFMIYILSSKNNIPLEDYELDKYGPWYSCFNYKEWRTSSSFGCLQKKMHITQAEKNGNEWYDINNRIIEVTKAKFDPKNFDKFNLRIAVGNLPVICKGPYKQLKTTFTTYNSEQEKRNKNFIKILTKNPQLIFMKDFGFGNPENCFWYPNVSEPFDKKALKQGELKFRKAYLNHIKNSQSNYTDTGLHYKEKEILKFLVNLIMLNPDIKIAETILDDDKIKNEFKSNYAVLLGAYDELKNNETYRVVRTISRTRLVLKILLALL